MAENLTTYTEIDPLGHLSVVANQVDYTTLSRDETALLYKSFGAGFWNSSSQFPHKVDCNVSGHSGSGSAFINVWALSNDADEVTSVIGGNLYLSIGNNAGTITIFISERNNGSLMSSDSLGIGAVADFFLTVRYDDADLFVDIFSDLARTTLTGTISITPAISFSYDIFMAIQSFDTNTSQTITGQCNTYDLGLGVDTTTVGVATAVDGGSRNINISMPYTDDNNTNNTYTVDYKLSADNTYTNWVTASPNTPSPFTDTITGLDNAGIYDVKVTYNDVDGVTGINPQTITDISLSALPNKFIPTTTRNDFIYRVVKNTNVVKVVKKTHISKVVK